MSKNKTKNQSAKATLVEVTKEMAKPRVAQSAREHNHILQNEALSRGEILRNESWTVQPTGATNTQASSNSNGGDS
jgi:hypothetical protein